MGLVNDITDFTSRVMSLTDSTLNPSPDKTAVMKRSAHSSCRKELLGDEALDYEIQHLPIEVE